MEQASAQINLKNILFLTDFSEPSSAALPYAVTLARKYGATVHALHVLTPEPAACRTPSLASLAAESREEFAQIEMQRVESALVGVAHEANILRDAAVWPGLERSLRECQADMVVIGTHGRTGAEKALLGSVAEEIFRKAGLPVLTIGPGVSPRVHNAARFRRVLLATDFSPDSLVAVPYALSLAQDSEARLILVHVISKRAQTERPADPELSVAAAMHNLHELVPPDAEIWCRPEAVVEYGEPAERILHTAKDRDADLIVLGVRDAAGHLSAATHLERTTAHKVVARAKCPVLTVRG
ncbi:MAG TPA: universal stress protein [Verrucomicrobiae bacterium]|nr:universal stress protein [Verrucomicrobiae bacterium]